MPSSATAAFAITLVVDFVMMSWVLLLLLMHLFIDPRVAVRVFVVCCSYV